MGFLDDYRKNKSTKAEDDAFDYFITDLLSDKLQGNAKTDTIYGMNMEKSLQGTIYPSMFYIFQYQPMMPEQMGKLHFIDTVPLILCTGVSDKTVDGLNFNMIPNDVRAMILDVIYDAYSDFYNKDIQSVSGKLINEQFASILVNPVSFDKLMTILTSKCSLNLRMACRTYSKAYISNIRLIEYDQWKRIPYLSFKDSLRGASLADIQIAMTKVNR